MDCRNIGRFRSMKSARTKHVQQTRVCWFHQLSRNFNWEKNYSFVMSVESRQDSVLTSICDYLTDVVTRHSIHSVYFYVFYVALITNYYYFPKYP
jgi:hypothetical protein